MSSPPLLHIAAGTRFGFQAGPVWRRKPRCLVESKEEVSAGPGLHLFVAPNGSGKTTLLRTLAGLSQPLGGATTTRGPVHYVSDELRADGEMKPRTIFRAWFKGKARARAEELADTLRLNLTCPVGKLSRGNRQKVLLILAEVKVAHSGAGVLLMDEPLTGLDAETRSLVVDLWANADTPAMRLVIMHELESVRQADSLLTITNGTLCHARERVGQSWFETYQSLQQQSQPS